jgi:hypothetical protein
MQEELATLKNSEGDIYVSVFYDTDLQATTDVWTGKFETQENFFEGLKLVLDNIKNRSAVKWLADLSNIEGDFEFARDYISKRVVPEAMKYGLLYEALVLPNTIVPMVAVQETLQHINDFQIRIFGTVEDAKRWLRSKD